MPAILIDWLKRVASKQCPPIKGKAGIPRATSHSLKHTSITEAVYSGAHVVSIGRASGHKNLKTTERYIHTVDEWAHEAMAKLPKLVSL